MTLENLKKKHAHLKWLASGEFTERDFDYTIPKSENPRGGVDGQGDGGWSTMGDMKPERKQLIQQDAARNLERFESKYPKFADSPKESSEAPKEKPKDDGLTSTGTRTPEHEKKKGKKDGN